MPIEFACANCNKRLRTPDEYAGRQTKCPNCGNPLTIPSPAAPQLPDDLELELESIPAQRDPFAVAAGAPASKLSGTLPPRMPTGGGITPTRIDIGDVFRTTWSIFKERWGLCIGGVVLTWLIVGFAQSMPRILAQMQGGQQVGLPMALLGLMLALVIFAVNIWLQCGLTYLFLRIARGARDVEISDLFAGGRWVLNYFVTSLLFGLMLGVGFVALIIPGIFLALMFWPCINLVVDQNLGITESLETARKITSGNRLTVLLMGILALVGGVAFTVVTLFVGGVVVLPFVMLLFTVTYLKMAGQPTADGRVGG